MAPTSHVQGCHYLRGDVYLCYEDLVKVVNDLQIVNITGWPTWENIENAECDADDIPTRGVRY